MERVALDTTFLIDLQNERRARGRPRGAIAFLREHQDTELLLPSIVLGEYLEGFDDPDGAEARSLVSGLRPLDVTPEVARVYAFVTRALRPSARLIGGATGHPKGGAGGPLVRKAGLPRSHGRTAAAERRGTERNPRRADGTGRSWELHRLRDTALPRTLRGYG